MKKLIPKHLPGGVAEAASYMIPIYGTYKSIQDAYNDPTLGNIGMAGLSAIGDIGTLVGGGLALKGAVAATRAGKVAKAAKAVAEANRINAATKAALATDAANAATRFATLLARMGVPIEQWAELQVYLRALKQQASAALKAAKVARNANYANMQNAGLSTVKEAWDVAKPYWQTSAVSILGGNGAKASGIQAKTLNK